MSVRRQVALASFSRYFTGQVPQLCLTLGHNVYLLHPCNSFFFKHPVFCSCTVWVIFLFSKASTRLWGSPSLLFNGYRCSFSVIKRPGLMLTIHFYPASRLKWVEIKLCSA